VGRYCVTDGGPQDFEECVSKFGKFGPFIHETVMRMSADPNYEVVVYEPPPRIRAILEKETLKSSQ